VRPGFAFAVSARDGDARAGRLETPHGAVATPAFMAVATYGAVRGVTPAELRALGAEIVLANTYHLHERPGEDVVAGAGGLHGFTGWRGPWLTDSGGYQVFSLAERVHLDEDGVRFASPLDGRRRTLTPEGAIAIQEALGADVAMVLDHCVAMRAPAAAAAPESLAPPRAPADLVPLWRDAMERSLRWGERCLAAKRRGDQALFGIVQGGGDAALRRTSARANGGLAFDGFAHGGLGLGEDRALRGELLAATHEALPAAGPRYLMGLGRPEDVVLAIERGVDLFDCVVPTRHGRHGVAFTRGGVLHLTNARFRDDPDPIEPGCDCPACGEHSRAYLRHLFASGDLLAARLATLHNLRFYYRLFADARAAIAHGRFAALRDDVLAAAAEGATPDAGDEGIAPHSRAAESVRPGGDR
jgi:queuine tRNA-ribosyltransferase